MPLTPIDVQQKTFVTTFRGYDLDEVDDFLDEVVTSLKDYEQRLHDAQQRIAILEAQAQGRGDSEAAISRALVSAQRSADLIVGDAKSEAERILAGARLDARSLESERDKERARLEGEMSEMRNIVAELKERIAALAGPMAEDADTMMTAVDAADQAMAVAGAEVADSVVIGAELGHEDHDSDLSADHELADRSLADEEVGEPEIEFIDVTSDEQSAESGGHEITDDESLDDDLEDEDAASTRPASLGWEVARDPKVEDAIEELPGLHERVPRPWEDV